MMAHSARFFPPRATFLSFYLRGRSHKSVIYETAAGSILSISKRSLLAPRARVASGRRRMILFSWRTEQLCEDRLERIGPHLISLDV